MAMYYDRVKDCWYGVFSSRHDPAFDNVDNRETGSYAGEQACEPGCLQDILADEAGRGTFEPKPRWPTDEERAERVRKYISSLKE